MVSVTSILKAVFSNFIIVLTLYTSSPHNVHLLNIIGAFKKKNDAIPPHSMLFSPPPSTVYSVDLIKLMDPLKLYSMNVLCFLPLKPFFFFSSVYPENV